MPPYLVFCDLDHSLLSVNSGKLMIRAGIKSGMLPRRHALEAFIYYVLFKGGLIRELSMIERTITWLRNMQASEVETFASLLFNQELVHTIRPGLKEELQKHKLQGAQLIILSSSMEAVCTPVARYLGFHAILCTHLELKDGKYTGKAVGPVCYGKQKLEQMLQYASLHAVDPANCWYYADEGADIHVLEVVGHPVCINPGRKLAKIAGKKGWILHLE